MLDAARMLPRVLLAVGAFGFLLAWIGAVP